MLEAHLNRLMSLSKNAELVITRPDKETGVVILDKTSYIETNLMVP